MPRRIIIHGGFHKTGMRGVQEALRANRVVMKKHVALRLRWHLRALIDSTHTFAARREVAKLAQVQAEFETLMSELPGMPKRSLILCAPELAGHMPGRPGMPDYTAAPDLFYTYWESAQRHFPQAEVAFVLSTRPHADWLRAVHAAHLAHGVVEDDFEAYSEEFGGTATLKETAAEIASRVPAPVHVTEGGHSALERLMDLCDLPDAIRAALQPAAQATAAS